MAAPEEPKPPTEPDLLKAVIDGNDAEVKIMLDAGASEAHKKFSLSDPANCTDPATGFPPLMLAAIHKHASMCELLVKKKASIDCVDQRGDSPLHKAAIGFDLPVIEALITK